MKTKRSFSSRYSRHQRANRRVVARHRVVTADEDEPVVGIDVALVVFGQPDVILDLLVRGDPADEQEVDEVVVQDLVERRPVGWLRDARQIDRQRQHAGRREPERLELPPIVVGDAEREIDRADQRRQFPAGDRGEPEERRIVGSEVRTPA